MEDRGEFVSLLFNPTEQKQTAGKKKPRVANVKELSVAYLRWLKEHKPEKLECKVEARLREEGFMSLWTGPYCPKTQPIESFWGNGKNHVANHYDTSTNLRDVVRRLQDGWYGNDHRLEPSDDEYTKGTRCQRLVEMAIRDTDNEFIPLCPGLSGRIGALTIDGEHVRNRSKIPIDEMIVDLTKGIDSDEE